MKKLLSLLLVTLLLLSSASALADTLKVGELTYLNSDSISRTELMDKVRAIAVQNGAGEVFANADALEMVEFDNLNAMQMALDAGQIDAMVLYSSVGNYLANTTGNYNLAFQSRSPSTEMSTYASSPEFSFVLFISDIMMGTDFSFMMREEDAALKDEFDQAIAAMQEEGMLDQLRIVLYGTDEPAAADMPVIEGAETIKVAVTGDLPPLDYMDADDSAAGYNTLILAEISKRIGKNIELVSTDAASRALALTSGSVDVVFWARVGSANSAAWGIDPETFPEEMKAVVGMIETAGEEVRDKSGDIPEGMILTAPYLHDIYFLVFPKA